MQCACTNFASKNVLDHTLKERKMEGIREISKSYYQKSTQQEKNSIQDFFKTLDINNDGKITLQEIKKSITSWLCTDDVFKELDVDGNETLDFDEVLCLYYMEKKLNIVRCSECFGLLNGAYFSCTLCLGKSPETYDLCCECYRAGSSSHEHSFKNLLDQHSLIGLLRERTAAGEESQRKKEIEELREIAKAHYQAASPQVQAIAYQFYQSMDTDGDGWVNLTEFLFFMRQEPGYSHMHNPYFFAELDRDGNGTLDFFEVMTLFYIIKSGRPFCGCCWKFIPGMFFSCVECFVNSETSYHLCRDCYRSAKCSHSHNGRAQFLDNYTLLQVRRDPALARAPAPAPAPGFNSNNAWTTSSNALVSVQRGNIPMHNSDPTNQYYNAHLQNHLQNQVAHYNPNGIVHPPNRSKWKVALNAFEVAITIGSIAGTAAACTIM